MNDNCIVLGDCLEFIKTVNDNSFDVSFTSPPYNRVRNDTYGYFDDVNDEYGKMLCDITSELIRTTKGNVIVNVQMNMYNKVDLSKWQAEFSKYIKGIVVWIKNNPNPASSSNNGTFSITNAYENFYVFGKDSQDFRANSKIMNYIKTNINSEHFEGHGAVMKYEIADFFIRNFSKEGDFVFDPFMGIGTTACACIRNKRRWGGVEIIPEYKAMAEKRIADFIKGEGSQMLFDFGERA